MGKYQNPLNINSLGSFLDSIRDCKFSVVDLSRYDFIDVYATMVPALAVRYICPCGETPDIKLPESEDVVREPPGLPPRLGRGPHHIVRRNRGALDRAGAVGCMPC
jgi:hypothetical protein